MTHEEVMKMLDETGIPYAYDHFAEGEAPEPPFICFLYPASDNFGADDVVYFSANELNIEVYTDLKDPELEAVLERLFTEHELYYEKTEVWIESEKLYEVLYSFVV